MDDNTEELIETSIQRSKNRLMSCKHHISDNLRFLWERYIASIHLTIILTGGTILAVLQSFKFTEKPYSSMWLLYWSTGVAILALISSLVWRYTAQYFMEREVLDDGETMRDYFGERNIKAVTGTFGKEKKYIRSVHRFVEKLSPFVLAVSWILLACFSYFNTANAKSIQDKISCPNTASSGITHEKQSAKVLLSPDSRHLPGFDALSPRDFRH